MKLGRTSGWVVVAERVGEYAPALGDLICYSPERYKLTYEKRRGGGSSGIAISLLLGTRRKSASLAATSIMPSQ
jgi:hypothetical protein